MTQLLVNKIKCPDGTVLQSKHCHDFQMHTQEDGREYFVDGGLEYQRVGFSDEDFEDLTCYTDDPHEKIRECFEWTSVLDENGERLEEPTTRLLKDLTDDHVEALVRFTAEDYPEYIHKVFVDEQEYRRRESGVDNS